ncbi:hypothetical protein [Anaerovibrio sp.]|uniref:hypothetical protein n=1 Tax=Anaerovibrio sp. TaxID=1872532 RepID=UPI0026062BE8|nr:hypothetical protein [Anaerovibrio sp.]MDD6596863.1 hypothetical protein [Anaerovibrio sp.]
MWKKLLSGGIAATALLAGLVLGNSSCAEASSQTNLGKERIFNSPVIRQQVQVKTYPVINVGYIVVGDDAMILDDLTMGYIRRMLNVKFPGDFYPPKRMESTNGIYQHGRRNYSDKYNLVEAKDILMKEFEQLERRAYEKQEEEKSATVENNNLSNSPVNVVNIPAPQPVENMGMGRKNDYSLTQYLSTLPKEDYVSFARQSAAEGKSDYDCLVMFNIHIFDRQEKEKFLGTSMWSDFCISVRAIDIATGEYIDRREYRKRGYSASGFGSPSWRRGMRRAIVDGMIECFDNLPIGKYSVCGNPYCARRQREIQEEAVLGRSRRHCVNHCQTLDNCDDHLVNYAIDADLPSGYVNNEHERVD